MAVLKCKMCGGDLNITADETVVECEYCGSKQTVPTADNEKKMNLFARANRYLRNCEFDKAVGVYESIIADFEEEAEAYWGLVLCRYGIEYVDDPATGNKVPTCHRSSFDSVMDDKDFELVMEYADGIARRVYREQAKQIEELRKAIIEVSGKEEPYDIFISYKETDDSGERTLDSVIAQDIYTELTGKGYRVFFSRISLEDKLGTEYEPYIFAALNSAKVMLVVGTDYDYFNAVWVKNEWSRFLALIAKGEKKTLIPVFKNIDAYDMPKEFAKLSAQDMGKVGAMQDLLRGVDKIMGRDPTLVTASVSVAQQVVGGTNVDALLKRGYMALEDGEFSKADGFFEEVLNQNAESAIAHLGKLMAELRVRKRENLKNCEQPFDDSNNYAKAVRFGDAALKAELEAANKHIRERNELARKTEIYNIGVKAFNKANYMEAQKFFRQVPGFKDADTLARQCPERMEEARKNAIYEDASTKMSRAITEENFKEAAMRFGSIPGFKNADVNKKLCYEKAEEARKESIYNSAINHSKDELNSNRYAIELFKRIPGWRDSDEQLKEREKLLPELEAKAKQERMRL